MRIGADAIVTRDARADINHCPPFAEFRAEIAILDQALAQAVQALSDFLARAKGKRFRSLVDFDTGDSAGLFDHLDERRIVRGFLPDRLVEEDDPRDIVRHGLGGAEQELPVIAAVGFGGFDADGSEALLDRSARFVGGENALAGRRHRLCHSVQLRKIHHSLRFSASF